MRLHQDEVRRREAVEALRKPRLTLSLPDSGTVNISTRGATMEGMGGSRQTVTTASVLDVVCVCCRNAGETAIRNARARVMGAARIGVDGAAMPLAIAEPIELSWKKDDLKTALAKDLAPAELCRIWVGAVRSQGQFWLYRDRKDLPIEYQQVFGPAGDYRVLIQVDADDAAPVQAILRVLAAEGEKLEAEVALIAQASPVVDWALAAEPAASVSDRRQA
jgi:hypothetical protein